MTLDTIPRAVAAIRAGGMVIVVDDEDRENEGDLCIAAEKATAEAINVMARDARGLICLALTDERLQQLDIPMMVEQNTSRMGTAFTVSIEAREGVTTGISAADRAHTIRVAVDPEAKPDDLVRPGHIFPLRARPGGVLQRSGHTEAVVDLARLAGLRPAGVICEIMNDDGTMARLPDLRVFAEKHELPIVSIADLIEYRVTHETLVRAVVSREVTHPVWGDVTLHAYATTLDARQHLVVVKGDVLGQGEAPLVRVHSGYPLSNVFGDLFSNDRTALNAALSQLGQEERAVLLCLDQGEAPIQLSKRIEMLGQDGAVPRTAAIQREIGIGAQILRHVGLTHIRLLTSNPRTLKGLDGYGLHVESSVPLQIDRGQQPPKPKLEVVAKMKLYVGQLSGAGLKIGLVVGRFNNFITEKLLAGAVDVLTRHGVQEGDLEVAWVPGAFDLPLVAKRMASSGRYDAVCALATVIRGGTPHFDYVASQVAKGVAQASLDTGVPVTFGVLTTDTIEQAIERAGTKAGNKGAEAAMAAVEMAKLLEVLPKE